MEIITVYFENGLLVKILPAEHCNQYEARYLVSDGLTFDLESTLDISNIPIPNYKKLCGFPNISHSLDYVLKRKAGNLSKNGLFDHSIVCLRKANQIMSQSPIHWKKKDYMDIVLELARVGRYEEAKKEKAFIEDNYFVGYDFSSMHETVLQKTLGSIHQQATDLVEADDAPNCDEICAKYQKRIYSISGKDKRFPAMTNEVYNSGLIFFPFIEGISRPKYCSLDNIIEYNNRPFIDDRTDEEKENYKQFSKQRILEERYATDYLEYCQICDFISLLQPKSFKSYQEMKYNNTENFQELMQIAEEAGIDIEL
ncbi:phage minor capsid protein [Enterocloster bolteae]|uniref:phage minor capsid protein n=1 Tax=Enterocloster bolteae TaxID=208479 RepID=UPI002A8120A3|nr:phage minor capsid protein [Enterocloster bolteae]